LISRLLLLFIFFVTSNTAFSSDCLMKATRIDVKRISQNLNIKSYVVDAENLNMTALLKNGRVLKLNHNGCEHSGAEVSMWLDSDRPFSDADGWIKEAIVLAKIAFPASIVKDISMSIEKSTFQMKMTESRVVIEAAPTSFMTYSIVVSRVESGLMLTIVFVLG
jgi:hypothetical protein